MVDFSPITSTSRCYNCLSRADEGRLQIYQIQNSLKLLLQTELLILCYICRKIAKNAENFIHNVHTVQNLFKEFINITDETEKSVMKRTLDLSISFLNDKDIIEINNPEIDIESDEKIKIEYNNNSENDSPELEIEILKAEQIENVDNEEFSDGENLANFICNLENTFSVKEERYSPELKAEESQVNIKKKKKEKIAQKIKSKRKIQCNDNVNQIALEGIDAQVETLVITNKQCLEERALKIKDKKYLESQYKCVNCIKGFMYKPSYEKHIEKHSKLKGDYECDICKLRVASQDKLNIHKRLHTIRYRCTVCNLLRVCRTSIEDHISIAHGTRTGLLYRCPKCNKSFQKKTSLRKHIYCTHQEKVSCVYCNKLYASKESIKSHVIRCHPTEISANKPVGKYPCSQCGTVCESPSQLNIHRAKHSQTRNYYCVECDKSFKTRYSLQQHFKNVSVHITAADLKFPCPKCKKRFTTKSHAERHLNDVHIKTARFYCDQCGKEFKCKYKLANHLRAHAGFHKPRNYFCSICKKGFQTQRILNVHLRIHTGEKPYHCALCPAQFNQYGSLYNHKRLVHKIIAQRAVN